MLRFIALPLLLLPFTAQLPDSQTHPGSKPAAAVAYLFPEQVSIAAGKPTAVALHFKVADGLHVNSHTPHADYLIPTTLKFPEASGVHLASAQFPAGTDYAFDSNPAEKLNVYTGEFIVHAELVAPKGDHLVEGTLRYQACNNQSCFPPKAIPVVVDVIAK